jgi:hypothetical protein
MPALADGGCMQNICQELLILHSSQAGSLCLFTDVFGTAARAAIVVRIRVRHIGTRNSLAIESAIGE